MKPEEHGICVGCTTKIIRSPQLCTSALPSSEAGAAVTSSLSSTESPNLYSPDSQVPAGCLPCLLLPEQELFSFQNTPPLELNHPLRPSLSCLPRPPGSLPQLLRHQLACLEEKAQLVPRLMAPLQGLFPNGHLPRQLRTLSLGHCIWLKERTLLKLPHQHGIVMRRVFSFPDHL